MPKKFSGQARALAALVKKVKKVTKVTRVAGEHTLCNYVTLLTVVTLRMLDPPNDEYFMLEALRQAQKAAKHDEVPIGAIVVRDGKIIARSYNQVELLKDATAHAEMLALTQAEEAVGDWRLTDCDVYVTKEPCAMCAGALVHTRIRRVIFGCADPVAGAAGSMINLLQMPGFNHRCDIASGVLQEECASILQNFFQKHRGQLSESA
jgi:tRNA(adenine34) deaminase